MSEASQAAVKWVRAEMRPALERKFRFQNRLSAWGFLAKMSIVMDTDDFYVEWTGNRVKIILTWAEAEPSAEVIQLAEKINEIL